MVIGTDVTPGGHAVCGSKEWGVIKTAYLLFAYGSVDDPEAAIEDPWSMAVSLAQNKLEQCLEDVARSEGKSDLNFMVAKLADTMRSVNAKLLAASELLGLGIYVGGVVFYCVQTEYLLIPFGGGCAFLLQEEGVSKTVQNTQEGLLTDALGGQESWPAQAYRGKISAQQHFIFSSQEPAQNILDQIPGDAESDGHKNTTAMLLRRTLEQAHPATQAVMELWV